MGDTAEVGEFVDEGSGLGERGWVGVGEEMGDGCRGG